MNDSSDSEPPQTHKYEFQAEINQLLSLIINTFYTNKDIFLRELISNASDALDRARYEDSRAKTSVENVSKSTSQEQNVAVGESDREKSIRITADADLKTLTIEDNGVGMTHEDLVNNLGTIARSGTRGFIERLNHNATADDKDNHSMIGQFGVGFYSAYLVADRVEVVTRTRACAHAHCWQSDANGTFTIHEDPTDTHFGTRIVMHIKEAEAHYLKADAIRELVKTHSQFIHYPIFLQVECTREVRDEPKSEEAETEAGGCWQDPSLTDDGKHQSRLETYLEWERQNEQQPVWVRAPADVTDEEYKALYKAISNDWDAPLAWTHVAGEGTVEYKAILYLPRRMPPDLYDSTKKHSIKLYVKRVFVMDEMDELVPEWLKFMRGLVDSEDLPLNISREVLQKNRVVHLIQKNLVKKCIEMFERMEPDDYAVFYKNYSKCLKLGVTDETKHRDRLLRLLRYTSSATIEGSEPSATCTVSLDDYVGRMRDGQDAIYFSTGETDQMIHDSPFLERLKRDGVEVLYMSDPIDEYVMQTIREYEGKKFVSCTRSYGDKDKNKDKDKDQQPSDARPSAQDLEGLCSYMKDVLGEQIERVVVGDRLVDSPCCLVSSEHGWTANMERIMRAQAMRDNSHANYMTARKIMEVNPEHPIIVEVVRRLRSLVDLASSSEAEERENREKREKREKDDEPNDEEGLVRDVIHLLYESSLVDSGFTLEIPKRFVRRINNMVALGLSLDTAKISEENDAKRDSPNVRIEPVRDPDELERIARKNAAIAKLDATSDGDRGVEKPVQKAET